MAFEKLLDGDLERRRNRYIFDLAHICHISPNEIDHLRVVDFVVLTKACDQYREEMSKANG